MDGSWDVKTSVSLVCAFLENVSSIIYAVERGAD